MVTEDSIEGGEEKKELLVWSEVIAQLNIPTARERVDLSRLGAMWVLDRDKRGRVGGEEVKAFTEKCAACLKPSQAGFSPEDSPDLMQAQFVLEMLQSLGHPGGKEALVDWIMRLLAEESKAATEREISQMADGDLEDSCNSLLHSDLRQAVIKMLQDSPDRHLNISAAILLYKVLPIKEAHGIGMQQFLTMLQDEELCYPEGDSGGDERLEHLVFTANVKIFLTSFVDGLWGFAKGTIELST